MPAAITAEFLFACKQDTKTIARQSGSDNDIFNFLQFSQDFSREIYRAFLFRKLRRAWPGLSGIFCACALKLTADTEHGVATGPAAYRIDSVSPRAGRYLET